MSGAHTFFSNPPEMISSNRHKYVLLTPADGIDHSFRLLVYDTCGWSIKVHASSSCGTTWELATYERKAGYPWSLKERGNPAILHGGVIHWLAGFPRKETIVSYELGTGKMGSVELPPKTWDYSYKGDGLYLATSSDGKLLKLLAIQGFMMSVWLQLPVPGADGSGWSLETVIDMEENMRSLDPDITGGQDEYIEFEGSGKRTGDVVFLKIIKKQNPIACKNSPMLIVFDLETNKMHMQKQEFSLLEIDLLSRLQTTKI
jgi:hypothetical protein